MPGWNLQTLKDRTLFYVTGRHKSASSLAFPDQFIFELLREAYVEIQNRLKLVDRQSIGSIVSGTDLYDLPDNIMGRSVEIQFRNRDNDGYSKLELRTYDFLISHYDITDPAQSTGDPLYFAYIPESDRRIIIRPTPNYAQANGILFITRFVPDQLWRIYNQTTITANVTAGSRTVVLSGNPNAGTGINLIGGDEFGRVYAANTDGSTSTDSPRRWYKITSVGTGTVTLDETWQESSASGVAFVGAQVPELENEYPSQIGFAPSMLAAATYFDGIDGGDKKAMSLRASAEQIISRLTRDNAQLVLNTALDPYAIFPDMELTRGNIF